MSDLPSLRLPDAWQQCERHLHHLRHALGAIKKSLPMTVDKLVALDDEAVQDWDQLILRFTKLQDAMGTKLFPATLDLLHEPYGERPILDKLHRLEKLGYLASAESWHMLQAIRNRFAYDHPEGDASKAANLNEAAETVSVLQNILERFEPLTRGISRG